MNTGGRVKTACLLIERANPHAGGEELAREKRPARIRRTLGALIRGQKNLEQNFTLRAFRPIFKKKRLPQGRRGSKDGHHAAGGPLSLVTKDGVGLKRGP